MNHYCKETCQKYEISQRFARVLVFGPSVIILLYGFAMLLPFTRKASLLLVQENYPVEVLTFILLISGSIQSLTLSFEMKKRDFDRFVQGFYILFSIGLFWVAMEEIAWGQQFLGFETPHFIKSINEQGELTLHNIKGLQGNSEYFRLTFGIGGLVGVYLNRYASFDPISVPTILLPGFLVITLVTGVDLFNDFISLGERIDWGIRWMSEVIEMLIGGFGFLYVWLMKRWQNKQNPSNEVQR